MRVLIVDDHAATVLFMRLAFEAAGHVVTTASDVDGAWRSATEQTPDVVLTDLTIGGATGGLGLGRRLRSTAATRDVGLLAVSGVDAAEVVQATVDHGFDGYVSKPVDLSSLLDRVARLGDTVVQRRGSEREVDRA